MPSVRAMAVNVCLMMLFIVVCLNPYRPAASRAGSRCRLSGKSTEKARKMKAGGSDSVCKVLVPGLRGRQVPGVVRACPALVSGFLPHPSLPLHPFLTLSVKISERLMLALHPSPELPGFQHPHSPNLLCNPSSEPDPGRSSFVPCSFLPPFRVPPSEGGTKQVRLWCV